MNVPEEIILRKQWNASMTRSLRECTQNGRSQVRTQINKNLSIIAELESLAR